MTTVEDIKKALMTCPELRNLRKILLDIPEGEKRAEAIKIVMSSLTKEKV